MTRPDTVDYVDAQAWLARQHEGRLGYPTGCGPRWLVVRYAVGEGRLLFRLPEYSSALGYARDQAVTLQVGGGGTGTGGSTVQLLVSGTARLVDELGEVDAVPGLDEHWPDGVATHVVALAASKVETVRS
jgi:hypothetical protein